MDWLCSESFSPLCPSQEKQVFNYPIEFYGLRVDDISGFNEVRRRV